MKMHPRTTGINLSLPLKPMAGKCLITVFRDVVCCRQIWTPTTPSSAASSLKSGIYFLSRWISPGLLTCFSCFNICPCQNATEMIFWSFWGLDLWDWHFLHSPPFCSHHVKSPTTPRSKRSEAAKLAMWKDHVEENQGGLADTGAGWTLEPVGKWMKSLRWPQVRPSGKPPVSPQNHEI